MGANPIVPFENAPLPSYLKGVKNEGLNDDLTSHAGAGFPVISIKGKVFAIVRGDERKIVPNPKDPDSPATFLDVVLLKANRGTSKIFYSKGYSEGQSDGAKPDCFSVNGDVPDPQVDNPPSKTCATCPKNIWGSKIGDNGQKSKACQDSVRIAVATPTAVKEPYLLRVPPASIKALGELGKTLKARGVKYTMVLTRIGFDPEAATPKLTFKPVGFLPEDTYKQVVEMGDSEMVKNILGVEGVMAQEGSAPTEPTKSKTVTDAEVVGAIAKAEAKPDAKSKITSNGEPEIDLGDLKFDD